MSINTNYLKFDKFFPIVLASISYTIAAYLGLRLATLNNQVTPFWPATGVAIGFIFVRGYHTGFGIFAAAFFVNFMTGLPLGPALCVGLGNTLEALIAVGIFNRFFLNSNSLGAHSRLIFTLLSMIVGTFIGATIGSTTLLIFSKIPFDLYWENWKTWWVGDTLGALFVFPFAYKIYLSEFRPFQISKQQIWKLLFVISLAIGICYFIFNTKYGTPFIFVLFLVLLLTTHWLETSWTYIISLGICVYALFNTYLGNGPFTGNAVNENLIHLQLFLASLGFTAVSLGSLKLDGWRPRARIALLLGWFITGTAFYTFYVMSREQEEKHFLYEVAESERALIKRVNNHIDVLKAGANFFAATENVTTDEWERFAARTLVDKVPSGVLGLGVIFATPSLTKEKFYQHADIRKPLQDFSIYSVENVPEEMKVKDPEVNLVITYIEPIQSNRRARGLNVATEMNRYQAALQARDTGEAVMTKQIQLVQDDVIRHGYLIYYPIYRNSNNDLKTVEQRRKAFRGFVYAPVVVDKFFKSALETQEEVHLSAYFGHDDTNRTLIFSSEQSNSRSKLNVANKIFIAGQQVTLAWTAAMKLGFSSLTASWLGFSGAMCALFLAIMISSLEALADRAQKIAQEMTEEVRRNQETLAVSARLSSLGEMASGVAHEINNPLTIILGKAKLIESLAKSKSEPDEKVLKSTEQIVKTVHRISKIIKGLQSFARETSNEPFESVPVIDTIQSTVELCRERFSKYEVALNVEVELSKEVLIWGREEQISQVLMNLLSNAFDAVQSLSEKWVLMKAELVGSRILLSVEDSGTGIPVKMEEKIFAPFFTTKEIGKGTGLGLSISKGIIDRHKGRIFLDRTCAHTRFVIELERMA